MDFCLGHVHIHTPSPLSLMAPDLVYSSLCFLLDVSSCSLYTLHKPTVLIWPLFSLKLLITRSSYITPKYAFTDKTETDSIIFVDVVVSSWTETQQGSDTAAHQASVESRNTVCVTLSLVSVLCQCLWASVQRFCLVKSQRTTREIPWWCSLASSANLRLVTTDWLEKCWNSDVSVTFLQGCKRVQVWVIATFLPSSQLWNGWRWLMTDSGNVNILSYEL